MCILLARCSLNVSFRSSFLHLGHVLLESKVAECNNFNVQKVIFFRHTHPPTHTHTLSHSHSLSLIHSLTHSLSPLAHPLSVHQRVIFVYSCRFILGDFSLPNTVCFLLLLPTLISISTSPFPTSPLQSNRFPHACFLNRRHLSCGRKAMMRSWH